MKRILLAFSVVYFPLSYIVGLSWIELNSPISFVTFTIWQLMLAKFLYDTVILFFVFIFPDPAIPKKGYLDEYPAVALLYVCRDDIVNESLVELRNQSYPNYQVFVLDDSTTSYYKMIADNSHFKVVRRNSLDGFKAGNINNWLKQYGESYKYIVIFDNDSRAESNFIEEMILYAEHEDNKDIAIFQSKVLPWNDQQPFPHFSGALAALQMAILHKVGNNSGTVISFGHNNLHRTGPLLEIGGFDERFTSEDTSATLMLSQSGYRTVLIDHVSYEEEPINIHRYQKRAVRWAGQTAHLFHHSWNGASGALKFEVCRQLIYYLINSLFCVWLIGSILFTEIPIQGILPVQLLRYENANGMLFNLLVTASSIYLLHYILHFFQALGNGIRIKEYFGSFVLNLSVTLFTTIPIFKALLLGLIGKKVVFNPSNSGNSKLSLFKVLQGSCMTWLIGMIAISRFWANGKNPWAYLNGWWATVLVLMPILILFAHGYPLEIIDGKRRSRYNSAIQPR